jgi:prenyltransferase beta subunit
MNFIDSLARRQVRSSSALQSGILGSIPHAEQASEYTFAIAATAETISKLETTHEF